MKLMINGKWHGDVVHQAGAMSHPIATGGFRGRVMADGSSGFAAEPGRYHLYVSYACPFAHRTILGRTLKRLESIVGLSILHPIWNTAEGWVFGETPLSARDRGGNGFTHLHQAYSASRPHYTGRITVPVLWDSATQQIVSNESLDILLMLNDAFDNVGADRGIDLYPHAQRDAIDVMNASIARDLAGRVYAIGGAMTQERYDRDIAVLFALLEDLELRLSDGRPFLLGDAVTISDVLAFTPLVRFDAVYNPLFRASLKRLVDYPRLAAYVRRIYGLPGVADTVRFDHILMHYHDGDWAVANRRGIVPAAPQVDFRSTPLAHSDQAFTSENREPSAPTHGMVLPCNSSIQKSATRR